MTCGLGIDLGIKTYVSLSNGMTFKGIEKSKTFQEKERNLRKEQGKLVKLRKGKRRRSYEACGAYLAQKKKVQALFDSVKKLKELYIDKIIEQILRLNPVYIAIEHLDIRGMTKGSMAKPLLARKFNYFRKALTKKCKEKNVELRLVDTYFPSSKKCSRCGNVKKSLLLEERIYYCEKCGLELDRDLNASINLRDATDYKLAFKLKAS